MESRRADFPSQNPLNTQSAQAFPGTQVWDSKVLLTSLIGEKTGRWSLPLPHNINTQEKPPSKPEEAGQRAAILLLGQGTAG